MTDSALGAYEAISTTTGADLLIECLRQQNVRRIFGMPGSHSTYVYDAIYRLGSIQTILCRNEQAGAFMADGYARSTGKPGIICTTAGPGATNALTGIGEAFSDSIPMLLIAGQVNHDRLGVPCGRYHELDLEGIFRPCTRFVATVMANDEISNIVQKAFEAMIADRPGPAAIVFPQDLMANSAAGAPGTFPVELRRMPGDPESIRRAAESIETSQSPVILAGGGAVASAAGEQIEELATRLGCPVITTLNGKGILDERSPWSLGHGRTRRARIALSRADLVIAIGCRFTEVFTASSSLPIPNRMIQIDLDRGQIGLNYPVEVGMTGDARTVLAALIPEIERRRLAWTESWQRLRGAAQLKREWLIETLRAVIPEDSLVFADASEMGLRMQVEFPAYSPRSFFYPSNFATMGWGLPAAIGGAVGQPARWSVCVAGDGGFLMTSQELATAVRYRLNLIVVIHNDSTYGAIKAIQRNTHQARYIDTELNNPDLLQYGESFGVPSCRANDAAEFSAALERALERGGPNLIEVPGPWRSLRIS